jgi:outer membrane protein OmpA-like peptidoglycan-associated protein
MKLRIFLLVLITIPVLSQAQFGEKLLKKVKNKVDQRADQKADKEIDKTLDEIEGKEKPQASPQPQSQPQTATSSTESATATPIKSYGKYDFVPGEKVIYANDFANENLGELPTGWNSNGNGPVTTINTQKGNWLQLNQNACYVTDNAAAFTENFTLEFDLILRNGNPKSTFPQLAFGAMSSGDLSTTDNELVREYTKFFAIELKLQPVGNLGSHMHMQTFEKNRTYLNTEIKSYGKLEKMMGQPIHIAMQIQKERLRVWINEDKMYDLPKAITAGIALDQLYFRVKSSSARDEETGYSVTNIKVATGLPDTRHKLVEEGKFSTTGILFDVNSATIKAESAGVLKEIADVLKKYPDISVKVIGHTDGDGSDASNLALSKKRAEAVKEALVNDGGIDAARLQSDGKGEKEPVGDNKTREGKMQNRRVEFIKR